MKAMALVTNAHCSIVEEENTNTSVNNSSGSNTAEPQTENVLWKTFDQRVMDSTHPRMDNTVGALIEKQQYLQHINIDRHEDPLVWWKQNCPHLPLMKELAKKYLCIPATSVPAERLFSKAGEVVSSKRSNIKPKNVDMLLFLSKNIRI